MSLSKPVASTRRYVQIARQIADAVPQEQFKVGDRLPPKETVIDQKFLADQQRIYHALLARNPSAAAAATLQHITNIVEDFFS